MDDNDIPEGFKAFINGLEHDLWRTLGVILSLIAACTLTYDHYK